MEAPKWQRSQVDMGPALRSAWVAYKENFRSILGAALIVLLPGTVAWGIFGLGIVASLLILVGTVFLIVPGIILMLMWVAAMPVLVVESRGVFASMSRSSRLTSFRRSGIFVYALLSIVGEALILAVAWKVETVGSVYEGAVALVGNALLLPFIAILAAEIYFRMIELDRQAKAGRS
ncbi:MAG: hypothetical protein M3Y23_07525 [Actinomycetota bacterium]|nr:hypothetical protein [Actinomycetota bacterium]